VGLKIHYTRINLQSAFKTFNSSLISKKFKVPTGHYADINMKSTVIPNRNAIFGAIIYGYALSLAMRINEPVAIGMGVHSGDHTIYPDCRAEFFSPLMKAFKLGNWGSNKVTYEWDFIQLNKKDVLSYLVDAASKLELNLDKVLKNTSTCYNPKNGIACGECGSCNERLEAFSLNHLKDPIKYRSKK
jgi:7-cyano-7-deazaguanine synthase